MTTLLGRGQLRKMQTQAEELVQYGLPVGDNIIDMNRLIGERLHLEYCGLIQCIHCGRKSKKSFSQGYCYPCFSKLAQCDSCIVSPEKCHYYEGSCREPEWGEANCLVDHIVYLANSSGLKVGITRGSQVPTRWMDQGAIQALPIIRVSDRRLSGLVEVVIKQHAADKTNWRAMLKGQVDTLDLAAERDRLLAKCHAELTALQQEHGLGAIQIILDGTPWNFVYPVEQHPEKVVSFNLDKNPVVEGQLMGIKGQYLIFDSGVINMRKYGGYELVVSLCD